MRLLSFFFIVVLVVLAGSFNLAYAGDECQVTKATKKVETDVTCAVQLKDKVLARLDPGDQVICVFAKGGIAFIPFVEEYSIKAAILETGTTVMSTDKDGTKHYKLTKRLAKLEQSLPLQPELFHTEVAVPVPGSNNESPEEYVELSCGVYAADG